MAAVEAVRGQVDVDASAPLLIGECALMFGSKSRLEYPHYRDPRCEDAQVADAVAFQLLCTRGAGLR